MRERTSHPPHCTSMAVSFTVSYSQASTDLEDLVQHAKLAIHGNMQNLLVCHSQFCNDVLCSLQQHLERKHAGHEDSRGSRDSPLKDSGCRTSDAQPISPSISHQLGDGTSSPRKSVKCRNRVARSYRPSDCISKDIGHKVYNRMGTLNQIVRSTRFETMSAIVIFANCVFVGYQLEDGSEMSASMSVIQLAFLVFFIFELLLRFCADWRYFVQHHTLWNLFDTVTVIGSVVELALSHFSPNDSTSNVSLMRSIRFLRCLRVLRMIRLKAFRELRLMVSSVICCIKPFSWTLVLLMMDVYVFAVAFTQCSKDAINAAQDYPPRDVAILSANFSDLLTSIRTLLAVLQGVVDWRQLSKSLGTVSWVYTAALVAYIFFTQLALLNVITAVFVDNSMAAALRDKQMVVQEEMLREGKHVAELEEVFFEASEGKDSIKVKTLAGYLKDEQVRAYLQVLGVKYGEPIEIVRKLRANNTGDVDVQEFVEVCFKIKSGFVTDIHAVLYQASHLLYEIHGRVSDIDSQMQGLFAKEQHLNEHDVVFRPSLDYQCTQTSL